MTATTIPADSRVLSSRLARWALVVFGVVCVGLGAAGVFVPGLPTTVFLIVAAWCFTRSCPWLEQKLIRNRLFSPFLGYLDRTEPMPASAKASAIGTMWLFVAMAAVAILWRGTGPLWISPLIAGAACVGTVVIVRWDAAVKRSKSGLQDV